MIKIYKKQDEPFKGSWVVETDTHIADALCWDEMLGLVASITIDEPVVRTRYMEEKKGGSDD